MVDDRAFGTCIAALICAACGSGHVAEESVERGCAEIVGGAPDDEHLGVMALLDAADELVCTGTLIGAGEPTAILTAAHCLRDPIVSAVAGADYSGAGALRYDVAEQFPNPSFDQATGDFDLAIVTLEGAVDPAWVLPILPPERDTLVPGGAIDFVGYGFTNGINENTERNAVAGTISTLTATTFDYEQDSGGPCDGDSGGPALTEIDGRETLVGVTSSGDPSCWGIGVSARVSAAYAFVAEVLGPRERPCSTK